MPTTVACTGLLAACGVTEPGTSVTTSAVTVGGIGSSGCSTAVVLGLQKQISDEIGCISPTSLVPFQPGSGITITSNAVLPYLAADAKADLMAVGNVQINSAFRTIAAQYVLYRWWQNGSCGISAAAPVGRSNHESGRAVDLANWSSRISAMSHQGWAHDVAGDPVHFDHLASDDIRGQDTLAFQRLWNRNNPNDTIAEDGDYGPQTGARLRASPATGFATGAVCATSHVATSDVVAVDGPDFVAPGAKAHYEFTVNNNSDLDWPETTNIVVANGGTSDLYDAASWQSPSAVHPIGLAIPAHSQGILEIDVVAPSVTTETPEFTQLALSDGTSEFGAISLAVTVTPNPAPGSTSGDGDDHNDTGGEVSGGCSAGGGGIGWLAFAPVLLVLRRRRR